MRREPGLHAAGLQVLMLGMVRCSTRAACPLPLILSPKWPPLLRCVELMLALPAHRYAFRREKYPSAPIDKYFECHSWANRGECYKNEASVRQAASHSLAPSRHNRACVCTHLASPSLPCAPSQVFMRSACPESCKDRYEAPPAPPMPKQKSKSKKKRKSKKSAAASGASDAIAD